MYIVTRNAEKINEIVNNASRPSFVRGYDGSFIDCRYVFENGAFAVMTPKEDGAVIIVPDGDGSAEAHVSSSGASFSLVKLCKKLAKDLLNTGTFERIYSSVPAEDNAGRKIAELSGMKQIESEMKNLGYGKAQPTLKYEVL